MKVKLDEGAFMPERAHLTDAGLDLRCREDVFLWQGQSAVFDTGVHIELPEHYYGKIEGKSGLNVNYGIMTLGGVIDEGYTGSIVVKLYNLGSEGHMFYRGDKIAQLIIQPYIAPAMVLDDSFKETSRGENGFGSTGK